MICFQILYLWYSVTSKSGSSSSRCSLWFAFKFCIFDILLHQLSILMISEPCCDLLSNFVSLIFCYITAILRFAAMLVVICFQILYLWYSVTSFLHLYLIRLLLWFAFKFCIFDILLHLNMRNRMKHNYLRVVTEIKIQSLLRLDFLFYKWNIYRSSLSQMLALTLSQIQIQIS